MNYVLNDINGGCYFVLLQNIKMYKFANNF